ncbi:MAG: hypothetical protein ACRDQ4_23475 [Pseudonocardiaceae bacterium]
MWLRPDAQPGTQPGFRILDAEPLLVTAMEQVNARTPTASEVTAKIPALDSSPTRPTGPGNVP